MNLKSFRFAVFFALFFLVFISSHLLLRAQLNPFALPQAKLAAAASATDTTLSVDNAANFPASGFVAIDTEIISYTSHTANSFAVAARAQGTTTAAAHSAGTVVTFFPANAGLLTAAIDAAATTININSTTPFPPGSGSMIIDHEILSYTGGTATTLTGLARGVEGTTAAAHNIGAVIMGRAAAPPTRTYIIPRLLSKDDNFAGLALANLSDGPAKITINALKSDGSPVTLTNTDGTTTQVFKSLTIPARQQFVGNMFDIFGNVGGTTDFYGQMGTGNAATLGVAPVGSVDSSVGLTRLDLAPVFAETQTDAILPISIQGSSQYNGQVGVEIGIVAQTFTTAINADFVDASGNVVQSTALSTNPGQRIITSLTGLFSNLSGKTLDSGYIHLTSPTGFNAYENVIVGKENGYLNAIGRLDAGTAVNVPFAISVGPYRTRLVITDGTAAVSGQAPVGVVNARVTAYNANGSLLSGAGITNPVIVTFPISGQYSDFIANVFGISTGQAFAGYLKVELASGSSSSGIMASALILQTDRNQLTAVPGQILPEPQLTLTPALFDPQITTAMAVVNPNANNATVQVSVTRGDGSVRATRSLLVPGNGQSVVVLSALFPDIVVASDGYVKLSSNLPIYSMIVFDDGIFLASGYPLLLRDPITVSPNPLTLATPNSSSVPASASTVAVTIQIPNPAPTGGLTLNTSLQNTTIATIPSSTVVIPEGQTSTTLSVNANISGGTVLHVTGPGFATASTVVNVQNTTDFTQARNVVISPVNPVVPSGGSIQFTATYDAANVPAVNWNVAGLLNGVNSVGTITQSGLFTAPLLLPTDQPLTVAVSITNTNTTFFGASTLVTITPPPTQ